MDNMQARMRGSEREQQRAAASSVQNNSSRYVSPHPVKVSSRPKTQGVVRWIWLAGGITTIALLALMGKLFLAAPIADGIDHNKYQAVFLNNNVLVSNVYFGKLERLSDGYYKLTNVYFLQNPAEDKQDQSIKSLNVAKMTKQAHTPEDALILPREQVLYYQNMQDSSKVVEFIKQDISKQ